MNYNNLSAGSIPSEIGLLLTVTSLLFGGNKIFGIIPSKMARLSNLGESLVSSCFDHFCQIDMVGLVFFMVDSVYLAMSDLKLNGTLPSSLGNLTNVCKCHCFWGDTMISFALKLSYMNNSIAFSLIRALLL